MFTDHCAPVTNTVLPGVPLCGPLLMAAPEITKRCANAAFLDLTVMVHEPCIVIAIMVSFSSNRKSHRTIEMELRLRVSHDLAFGQGSASIHRINSAMRP